MEGGREGGRNERRKKGKGGRKVVGGWRERGRKEGGERKERKENLTLKPNM